MYEKYETDISHSYLKEVLEALDEPICLMGGWAVRYLVNQAYTNTQGRDYLGSRDIDLGFQVKKEWSLDELKNSDFSKAMNALEKKLSFELQGFRLLKEVHTETGKELSDEEAKATMPPFIFDMYVDLMVSAVNPHFKEAFGFVPAEELLLEKVFSDGKHRVETELFGKKVYLPSPEVLLAMKFNAVINRDKEHKQIKDLYDIVALALYVELRAGEKPLQGLYSPDEKSRKKLNAILNEKCTDEFWQPNFGIAGGTAKKIILRLVG